MDKTLLLVLFFGIPAVSVAVYVFFRWRSIRWAEVITFFIVAGALKIMETERKAARHGEETRIKREVAPRATPTIPPPAVIGFEPDDGWEPTPRTKSRILREATSGHTVKG